MDKTNNNWEAINKDSSKEAIKIFEEPKIMPFYKREDMNNVPVLTFYQGDKEINLIVDTGSSFCIIDDNFLRNNLEYEIIDGLLHNIMDCKGNKTEDLKVVATVVKYEKTSFEIPFIVRDMSVIFGYIKQITGVTIHGYIGANFLYAHKFILDFCKSIAVIKDGICSNDNSRTFSPC